MTNYKTSLTGTLPVVLMAAVVQGWALYGLHMALKDVHWPATQPGWLLALYALAIFVPLTTQLLAEHARLRALWLIVAAIAVMFGYFGWHHGAMVMDASPQHLLQSDEWVPLGFVLTVLWLLLLPFIQARLADGHWRPRYQALFAFAWRNKLTLAEAVLFTGLFWLLLFLWAKLFDMLGIAFFEQLFQEPIFIYPVTSLAFGCALQLIGSVERLTSVILEQLLNVLKWLALLAGLILALFTVALVFKLSGMITSGERAIGAAWLLWLVAVTVLLVNAAYRDGAVEQPYPSAIALGLRFVVPLTVVIALTAIYAMYLRIDSHGFTVTRVWALIVAVAALIYSIGYGFAASRGGRWMAGIARINIAAALFLMATLALALTPLLSPYRIAANSQFRLAQAEAPPLPQADDHRTRDTPLHYLRFSSGGYGIARLEQLTKLQDHPRAARIRQDALAIRAQLESWQPLPPADIEQRLAGIRLYPAERRLDAGLRDFLAIDLKNPELRWVFNAPASSLGGTFLDLNQDGDEEFVLVAGPQVFAYTRTQDGGWRRVGRLVPRRQTADGDRLLQQILSGQARARAPAWQELEVGGMVFRSTDF